MPPWLILQFDEWVDTFFVGRWFAEVGDGQAFAFAQATFVGDGSGEAVADAEPDVVGREFAGVHGFDKVVDEKLVGSSVAVSNADVFFGQSPDGVHG